MAIRDTGWIQVFAENGQQAFDLVLWAFRVGEDLQVLFPVVVNFDGFHLTHVVEPIFLPEQSEVDQFLSPYRPLFVLNPNKPVTMGGLGAPFIYTETKKAQDMALRQAKKIILQGWKEFEEIFGRRYLPVESYMSEGARVLLLTMGSFSETAMVAIDQLRRKGEEVGLLRLRLWRPFPFEELRQATGEAEVLLVLDRCLSFGGPGPVASEVKAALYREEKRPKVVSFVGGLGGRDIKVEEFEYMFHRGIEIARDGLEAEFEMIGVKE